MSQSNYVILCPYLSFPNDSAGTVFIYVLSFLLLLVASIMIRFYAWGMTFKGLHVYVLLEFKRGWL